MHEHDTDLILALASGELDGPHREAAVAEVAACSQCSSDLDLQLGAIAYLSDAPRVYLTATESARLREGVRGSLGLEPEAAPTPPRRAPRRFRLGALAGAAAVLVAVVAAAPALNLVGGGGSTDAGDDVFAVATPQTEIARGEADMTTGEPSSVAPESEPLPAAGVEAGDAIDPAPTAAAPTAPDVLPSLPDDVDIFALKSSVAQRSAANSSDGAPGTGEEAPPSDVAVIQDVGRAGVALGECDLSAVAGISDARVEILGTVQRNGGDAVVVAFIPDDGDVTVVIIDPAGCGIIESTSS